MGLSPLRPFEPGNAPTVRATQPLLAESGSVKRAAKPAPGHPASPIDVSGRRLKIATTPTRYEEGVALSCAPSRRRCATRTPDNGLNHGRDAEHFAVASDFACPQHRAAQSARVECSPVPAPTNRRGAHRRRRFYPGDGGRRHTAASHGAAVAEPGRHSERDGVGTVHRIDRPLGCDCPRRIDCLVAHCGRTTRRDARLRICFRLESTRTSRCRPDRASVGSAAARFGGRFIGPGLESARGGKRSGVQASVPRGKRHFPK